jgi:hypothetical protein
MDVSSGGIAKVPVRGRYGPRATRAVALGLPQKLHAVVFNFMANLFNPEPSTRPARKVTCIQPFAPFSILSLVFPSPNNPRYPLSPIEFFSI